MGGYILPRRAVIKLAINCKLTSRTFMVHKLTFKHLEAYTTKSDSHFQVLDELATKQSENEIKLLKVHDRLDTIEKLQENNKKFKQNITDHIKVSHELWNAAQGGRTAWEQIIIWSLLGFTLFITAVLASWVVILQVVVWKSGKGESGEKFEELEKEISRLRRRVMDMETDMQLAESTHRRPPAYNPDHREK